MKKIALFLLVALAIGACTRQSQEMDEIRQQAEKTTVKDGMFIHVTSNDPHRVLMALNMAEMISGDHDVLMYFDIDGVKVLVKDAPDITYAQFPGSHGQLKKLIDKGVIIQACPGCLEAAGYSEADLMDGIVTADKERFFSFTNGRIITLDY